MQKDRSNRGSGSRLFRRAAVKAAGFRLFGDVCVALPPSAFVCTVIALTAIALLTFVLWIVEVPSRIMATGMLVPRGGVLDVVAPEPGQVSVVYVREEQVVEAGDVILEIAPHGEDTSGSLSSAAELQSLRDEHQALDVILERRQAIFREQQTRLSGEAAASRRHIEIGTRRAEIVAGKIAVLEARVGRLAPLAEAGHVAHDSIEAEKLGLLEVRNTASEIEGQLSAARAKLVQLDSHRNEVQREMELVVAEHGVRKQSLMREIRRREYHSVHTVVAPRNGTIARLPVRAGMPVRERQLVAKILAEGAASEAWLYVASANARHIGQGESVELQMDAWPAAKYGTLTATVTSVSGFVLGPAEIPVPLAVNGPVFEVRALIPDTGLAGRFPGPGATFKAQIISRRYRLYQWLTKRLGDAANPDRG